MSNINWGQLFNNFSNNFNRVINTNNANNNSSFQVNSPIQNALASSKASETNVLPQTTTQINQAINELALLNQQETVNMLKDLLNLPKNFNELISQITTNSQQLTKETILNLLSSSTNLSNLATLLQNNSKEALSKLYTLMAQYNQIGLSLKEEQIAELTKLISLTSASTSSNTQMVKTIMLMYLPWLPLSDPNAFKLEMTGKGFDSESINDDDISIMILTINYGNVKINIIKTSEDGIKIELISSETFPHEKFITLMKEESRKYSININFAIKIKPEFNKEKNEKSQTQVCMHTSPGVNPFLLLISNAVIKNVHITDSIENVRNLRKERFENG